MHASRIALLLHGYVVTGEVVCNMQIAQECQRFKCGFYGRAVLYIHTMAPKLK